MKLWPASLHLFAACAAIGALVAGSTALAAGSSDAAAGVIVVSRSGEVRALDVTTFPPHQGSNKIVDIALSPTGKGYATINDDGEIESYGDAAGLSPAQPSGSGVSAAAIQLTPTGRGALVAFTDGTVRAVGDAPPWGRPAPKELPGKGPETVVDLVLAPNGDGLWLLHRNGAVDALGGAVELGDAPGSDSEAAGIAATPTGSGVWIARENGSVVPLGDASGARAPRDDDAPKVTGIASLGTLDAWVVSDVSGQIERAGHAPEPMPGSGGGVVAIDTLAATLAVMSAGPNAPETTKIVAPGAVLGASGNPAETLVVRLPGFVTGGTFPLELGDVFATGIGPETPAGLLRRITNLAAQPDGSVSVTTEPATLSDALPAGAFDFSDNLSEIDLPDFEPTTSDGFVTRNGTPVVFGGRRSGGSAAAAAGAVGTFADPGRFTYGCPSPSDPPEPDDPVLKVKPSFSFDPEVIFDVDWDDEEAHVRLGLGLQGQLGVDLTATGTIACDAKFALIDDYSLGTKVFFIGFFPVVVEPKLSLEAKLEGKAELALTATASATGSASAAVDIDIEPGSNGTVSLDSSALFTGNLTADLTGKVEASFTLTPSMGFLLYAVVAPTAELESGLTATLEPCANPNLKLEEPVKLTAKLKPSEWLGEMLRPLENIDLEVENEFELPGSPFLLHSEHIPTPLPCEETTTLPDGTTGQPYSTQLDIEIPDGATNPSYAVASGSTLPPGLALASNGVLSGSPTQSGIYTFSVTVTHSLGSTTATFELTVVQDSLKILTESLPGGVVDESYSTTLQANRPVAELVWTLTGGTLPDGISLDPNGTISGTPTEAGFFPITIQVSHPDSGETAEGVFSIGIPGEARIAFVSERDGNLEIYVMNADGSEQTRLTNNQVQDAFPSWSPDRTRIAFSSIRFGRGDIHVMNADGSGHTRLTNFPLNTGTTSPEWSPDGTRILFLHGNEEGSYLYVMNADGSGQTRLATGRFDYVSWSPDGTKISFTHAPSGQRLGIYVMNADGSGQTRLTSTVKDDTYSSWSPDGTRIAFDSTRDGKIQIYVMNADGSGQTRLTNTLTHEATPSWSPDGTRIAFMHYPFTGSNVREVYAMNADGSGQTRLTNTLVDDNTEQFWSPDGTRIAFVGSQGEIYVVKADGSGETRLTNNPARDIQPAWSR